MELKMIKKLLAVVFAASTIGSTVSSVGAVDFNDEANQIQNEINKCDLLIEEFQNCKNEIEIEGQHQFKKLQQEIENNRKTLEYIKSLMENENDNEYKEGYKIQYSDLTTSIIADEQMKKDIDIDRVETIKTIENQLNDIKKQREILVKKLNELFNKAENDNNNNNEPVIAENMNEKHDRELFLTLSSLFKDNEKSVPDKIEDAVNLLKSDSFIDKKKELDGILQVIYENNLSKEERASFLNNFVIPDLRECVLKLPGGELFLKEMQKTVVDNNVELVDQFIDRGVITSNDFLDKIISGTNKRDIDKMKEKCYEKYRETHNDSWLPLNYDLHQLKGLVNSLRNVNNIENRDITQAIDSLIGKHVDQDDDGGDHWFGIYPGITGEFEEAVNVSEEKMPWLFNIKEKIRDIYTEFLYDENLSPEENQENLNQSVDAAISYIDLYLG